MGCGWLQGEKKGMGGARQARGIGVKEMLTDTINVICLLPQEVDGSLYCPFVPPHVFSSGSSRVKSVEGTAWKEERRRANIPRVGRVHLKMYRDTITNYLFKKCSQ